jgi:uncharacterized protein YdeI (YjbR/CyaY-like superfamily)
MEPGRTLYAKDRRQWRRWLEANFDKEKEIWLVYPYKHTGRPRISYNDAVEEALSFGWIDSTVKRLDPDSTAQRFSPRRPGAQFSQANKERLRWLLERGAVHPSAKASAEEAVKTEFEFPEDIVEAVSKDPAAWRNYQGFSPAYRRIRVAYIEGARARPAEFRKRLSNFITRTAQNKLIGFGGIEKYY